MYTKEKKDIEFVIANTKKILKEQKILAQKLKAFEELLGVATEIEYENYGAHYLYRLKTKENVYLVHTIETIDGINGQFVYVELAVIF